MTAGSATQPHPDDLGDEADAEASPALPHDTEEMWEDLPSFSKSGAYQSKVV